MLQLVLENYVVLVRYPVKSAVVARSYLYWSYYKLRSEQGSVRTVGWSVAVVSLLLGSSFKLLGGRAQTYAQYSYSDSCTW